MSKPKIDERIWRTEDGNLFTSIPTKIPRIWVMAESVRGGLAYVSGDYTIDRRLYGKTRYTYTVSRQGVRISLGEFALLRDAKTYAQKNARGEDRVNIA